MKEEQIEQFQKEHPSAEFVQITGGHTTHEKIWFKYDDGVEQLKLNGKQEYLLRELVCQFDTFGSPPTPFQAIGLLMLEGHGNRVLRKTIINLDKKQQAQVLRAFADLIEQEEK